MDSLVIVLGTFCAGVGWMIYTDQTRPPPTAPAVVTPPPTTRRKKSSTIFPQLLEIGLDYAMSGTPTPHTRRQTGPDRRRKPGPTIPTTITMPVNLGNLEQRLLNLIGPLEAPQGYDQVYGGSRIQPPRPITTITIAEVLEWQDASVRAGSASSAAGRFQFIRSTLRSLVSQGHARMTDRFDQATQNRLAVALMERRGLKSYKSNRISSREFGQRLSMEWASLPAMTVDKKGRTAKGQSYYAGDGLNKSLVSQERVLAVIEGRGV